MNHWFNFNLPYFNEQFGTDWDDFVAIIDDNVDYVMGKTYDLYKLRDISMMPLMATEMALKLRNIDTEPDELLSVKKSKLRRFNTDFKSKGMQDTYLNYQELVAGIRGVIYNGYVFGNFVWDTSHWPVTGAPDGYDIVWATGDAKFDIYIDCKTLNSDELDEIVMIFQQSFLLPAFYNIYLIDSSFNILRTV